MRYSYGSISALDNLALQRACLFIQDAFFCRNANYGDSKKNIEAHRFRHTAHWSMIRTLAIISFVLLCHFEYTIPLQPLSNTCFAVAFTCEIVIGFDLLLEFVSFRNEVTTRLQLGSAILLICLLDTLIGRFYTYSSLGLILIMIRINQQKELSI